MNPQNFTVPSDVIRQSKPVKKYCPRCNTTRSLLAMDVVFPHSKYMEHRMLCEVCVWPVEVWVELMPWL